MSSFVPEKYPNIPYNALPILPSFFDFFCFRVAGEKQVSIKSATGRQQVGSTSRPRVLGWLGGDQPENLLDFVQTLQEEIIVNITIYIKL